MARKFLIFLISLEILVQKSISAHGSLDYKFISKRSVEVNKYQYVVDIGVLNGTNVIPRCGASVITKKLILTAAHCLRCDENKIANVDGFVAITHCLKEKTSHLDKIIKGVCHNDWNDQYFTNDVGIAQVEKGFHPGINPVNLAFHDNVKEGLNEKNCLLLGWGVKIPQRRKSKRTYFRLREYTYDGTNLKCAEGFACDLHQVSLPTISIDVCKQMLAKVISNFILLDNGSQICGFGDDKEKCRGESGGPVICDGVQYGIISWGMGCGPDKVPGIFTRVNYFSEWINNTMVTTFA